MSGLRDTVSVLFSAKTKTPDRGVTYLGLIWNSKFMARLSDWMWRPDCPPGSATDDMMWCDACLTLLLSFFAVYLCSVLISCMLCFFVLLDACLHVYMSVIFCLLLPYGDWRILVRYSEGCTLRYVSCKSWVLKSPMQGPMRVIDSPK